MEMKVCLLPTKAKAHIFQYYQTWIINSFFDSREQEINSVKNTLEDVCFEEAYCSGCEHYEREPVYICQEAGAEREDEDGELYESEECPPGECRLGYCSTEEDPCSGGYYILKEGECEAYSIDEFNTTTQNTVITGNYFIRAILDSNLLINVSQEQIYMFMYNAHSEQRKELEFVPYKLGNVYDTGTICYPYDFRSRLCNLREAHQMYWTSPFNTDLIIENGFEDLETYYDDFSYSFVKDYEDRDYLTNESEGSNFLKGKAYMSTTNPDVIGLCSFKVAPQIFDSLKKVHANNEETNSVFAWLCKGKFIKNDEEIVGSYVDLGKERYSFKKNTNQIDFDTEVRPLSLLPIELEEPKIKVKRKSKKIVKELDLQIEEVYDGRCIKS